MLIYGDKVVGLEEEMILDLHQNFTGDIHPYEKSSVIAKILDILKPKGK